MNSIHKMLKQVQHDIPALFIGRFQPLHLGHIDALRQIFRRGRSIIIAIGSAQEKRTAKNPWSAWERKKMLTAALKRYFPRTRVKIFEVPDINNDNKWVKYAEKCVPNFAAVYTGSQLVRRLFLQDGRHPVIRIRKNKKISATLVRRLMRQKKPWRHLVPINNFNYKKRPAQRGGA